MRLYPPVPTIARELDEPLKIQSSLNDPTSCVIPRKTSISLMIFAVHQNQHLWDNPEVNLFLRDISAFRDKFRSKSAFS